MLNDSNVSKKIQLAGVPVLMAMLAGCGGGLMAPDPWGEDPGAEAFLDRVAKQCAREKVGASTLPELINDFQNSSQSDYFIDLTTKLYFGKVSKAEYASDVNAFFPGGDNQKGLDCIFARLEGAGNINKR